MTGRTAPPGEARDWRVLGDDGGREPEVNLAREEAVARGAGPHPTLRLWRNRRCVVLGRSQIAAAEADLAACAALGVPVLRRFTGGGAVYHDPGNLNVSLVVGRDDLLVRSHPSRGLLPGVYGLVLEPLAAAVRVLGAPAVADERAVWVGGRKVSGVAAWLGATSLLVHATLLVDADLAILERALAGPGAPGDPRWERTRSRRVAVTTLAAEGLAAAPASVDRAVVAAFGATGGRASPLSPAEREAADRLLATRYGRPEWHAEGRDATS